MIKKSVGGLMSKSMSLVEKHALKPMERVSQQRYLLAIREGVMGAFPLTLIASLFLVVTALPLPADWPLKQFITERENVLLAPYRMTIFIITLYIVISIGASLSEHYKHDQISGSLIAVVSFLMTIVPVNAISLIPQDFLSQAVGAGLDIGWAADIQNLGWVIQENVVGESGVLSGALAAIFGVEVMHWYNKHKLSSGKKDKNNKVAIPPSVARTLDTILPIFIVIITLFIARDILNLNIHDILMFVAFKVVQSASTLHGALLLVLMGAVLWTLGIRGLTFASAAATPLWILLLQDNMTAFTNNQPIPNIAPRPFYQWFVWIGGAGATLSLVILLCFSKSRYLRKLGLTSLLPSLLNINEPVIYGVPLILNPYFSIPFVLGPISCAFVSYLAMYFNLVSKPFSAPPALLPAPVGAYMATGDWRAVVLCFFNIGLCAVIYYPFLKAYEEKVEREGEATAAKRALQKDAPPKLTTLE